MIPEEEIEELKDKVNIVDVIGQVTTLQKVGNYYTGLCCFHPDENIGSFKVDERKQSYKCYSCGSGGDVIGFLTNLGKSFKETVEALKEGVTLAGIEKKPVRVLVPLAEWIYIRRKEPIDPIKFIHSKFGKPADTYPYFNEFRDVVGYVLRYYDKHGKKQILPFNWATCVKEGWEYEYEGKGAGKFHKVGDIVPRFIGFGESKPIYGLERLRENPVAKVLVVEGEKCVDFLQKMFDPAKVVVICWQGGAETVARADWSVLIGREVYLVPDNDYDAMASTTEARPYIEQPSPKAFNHIRQELVGTWGTTLYWVKPEHVKQYPSGWDLADTDWDVFQVVEFIIKNQKKCK